MKISGKIIDRFTQIFALIVLLGIAAALISLVKEDQLPFITNKDIYADVYAYTEESDLTEESIA